MATKSFNTSSREKPLWIVLAEFLACPVLIAGMLILIQSPHIDARTLLLGAGIASLAGLLILSSGHYA